MTSRLLLNYELAISERHPQRACLRSGFQDAFRASMALHIRLQPRAPQASCAIKLHQTNTVNPENETYIRKTRQYFL